jgi:hypothetical protein
VHSDRYDVRVSFKSVRYSEGDRYLVFDREPAAHTAASAVIWFPSPKRWRETVPVWAQERRGEILARIRTHAANDEFQVYYAAIDSVRDDDLSSG